MSTSTNRVAVVGAGPVGAVTALGLAIAGFEVTLIEAETEIVTAPRAATVHPSTLDLLEPFGILDEAIRVGLVARYFDFWDRPTSTRVARFDHAVLDGLTAHPFVVQIEQHKIVRIALERLAAMDNVRVLLGTRVEALDIRDDGAVLSVIGPDGPDLISADRVVGSDGGRSTVRKQLGIEFDGFTWPERFIVLTTSFDLERIFDCDYRNYFSDPVEWVNLFKVAGDDGSGLWRAVFPVPEGESDEEALSVAAGEHRLAGLSLELAGAEVVHRNLYRVHQRVAASFGAGPVLLIGDAAHVNNPVGGLGLNSGIHDASDLVTTLVAERDDGDQSLLDRFRDRRRTLNIEFVQEQTVANKRRLEETDPQVRAKSLENLRESAADPERAREFLRRTSLLASLDRAKALA